MKAVMTVAAVAALVGTGYAMMGGGGACGASPVSATLTSGGKPDIVATAVANGNFRTLAAALTAADLVKDLQGQGPFTVFAPTDEAFEKLGTETISTLLMPENREMLRSVLKYHVVPGNVTASEVVKSSALVTLNGQRIDVKVKDGKVYADKATVTATDVLASNGVIHVIDSVILPSDKNIVQTAAAAKFTTLAMLLEKAGLTGALEGPGPFTVFAPTDEAFAKIDKATLESLLKPENKEKLVSILTYHVVPGRVFSPEAVKAGTAKTLQGGSVTIKAEGGTVRVNGAAVVGADVDASNGVIHVVDTVLMPRN